MRNPASHRPAHSCAFCGEQLVPWPDASPITTCERCRRPMVLWRPLIRRANAPRAVGLLQCGYALYGLATVALVTAFILLPMPPRIFARHCAVLLFIIGSVLIVDGVLGIRTRVDRLGDQLRTGTTALATAAFRVGAGVIAMLLCAYGLMMI